MLRYSLVLAAGFALVAPLSAATWAEAMFDDLKHDFGSVPRGPTLQHHYKVTNNTKNAVTISSVRVSCGCVSAVALKGMLQPGESTSVQANMDTTRFVGHKAVTIFIQFSSPAFEEVRLLVQANGRTDFALAPDTLTFGQVKRGTSPPASVSVTFYGHAGAKVVKAKAESNYVLPEIVETRRTDGEVVYTLTAKMRADTPVGKWYTDVWLESTVAGLSQIRVPLTVEVLPPLTASPSQLTLSAAKVGDESAGKILLRGTAPFKIVAIKGGGADVSVTHDGKEREVHILSVKAKPGKAGKVERTVTIVTDLKADNEVTVKIDADFLP